MIHDYEIMIPVVYKKIDVKIGKSTWLYDEEQYCKLHKMNLFGNLRNPPTTSRVAQTYMELFTTCIVEVM